MKVKKLIFLVILILSMGVAKSQVFILGNPSFPTVGGMVHFQTSDVNNLGFYNYIVYGQSNKTNDEMKNLKLGAGLSYYFSDNNDPQVCWRIYWGFNKQVFWDMSQYEDLMFPTGFKDISFDLGVSKSFDFGLSILVLLDPINNLDYKLGLSYYF